MTFSVSVTKTAFSKIMFLTANLNTNYNDDSEPIVSPDRDDSSTTNHTKDMPILAVLGRSVTSIMYAAPKEVAGATLLHALQGIGPVVALLFVKIVIDTIARFDPATGNVAATLVSSGAVIAAFIFAEMVIDSSETLSSFVMTGLESKVEGRLCREILVKVSSFNDISLFENPKLLNLVRLAEGGVGQIQTIANKLGNLTVGFFSFVPIVVLSASIAWWIPLLIFLTSLPSIYFQSKFEQQTWDIVEAQAEMVREKELQQTILLGESFAKDIRLFQIQSFFLRRWDGLFKSAYDEMLALRRRGSAVVILWSLFSGVGVAVAYLYLIVGTLTRQHSLGDLAVFTGLIFQVRHTLFILLGSTSNLFTLGLEARAVFTLLETAPSIVSGTMSADKEQAATASPDTKSIGACLEFKEVSFHYPNRSVASLSGINLRVAAGETVAIVGENGAGKTTLAKLACRLYDPTNGEILWDGQPLTTLDISSLRSRITWVGQDFARFVATLRENVAFGWLPAIDDNTTVAAAVTAVGLPYLMQRSEDGLNTLIGSGLEGGTSLSGGQWQRIAIARALMRKHEARLMILDEPTSALDAQAEHEILSLLQTLATHCTGIIITHRLSLARVCDRIVVLDKGRVAENGTHNELMRQKGIYCGMFQQQASRYLNPDTDLVVHDQCGSKKDGDYEPDISS